MQHTVHFDIFLPLIDVLAERERLLRNWHCSVQSYCRRPFENWAKVLKKHETDYSYDMRNDVMVIRWMDNSEVIIVTNYDAIDPMVTVQRYSKEIKKKVGIQQPLAFNNYNRHMGGVDLHDNYRIGIRGKKWWWPLWFQCLDSAVVNA